MALYDGFFDAVLDESGRYDQAYDSGDFTGYFEQIIGSGVCVYENPESFFVQISDGTAEVSPGYLFIRGYWLKNTEYYPLELPEEPGSYAVLARLNLGSRLIELVVEPEAASYVDCLVLAVVNASGETPVVTDTRYDSSVCGTIDGIGSLAEKVEWAVNYIDTEITGKLEGLGDAVAQQVAVLNETIEEASQLAASLSPAAVGTVKFSASQNMGENWLRCDGSFINEADYPDLVAALGKLTPGVEQFYEMVSPTVIPRYISNGVTYQGYFWVFSQYTNKLFGVNLDTKEVKEITVIAESSDLTATTNYPIYLSILESGELFLFQTNYGIGNVNGNGSTLLYATEFDAEAESVLLSRILVTNSSAITGAALSYFSKSDDKYYFVLGCYYSSNVIRAQITDLDTTPVLSTSKVLQDTNIDIPETLYGYNAKNSHELVLYYTWYSGGYRMISYPKGIYSSAETGNAPKDDSTFSTTTIINNTDYLSSYGIASKKITLQWVMDYRINPVSKEVEPNLTLPSRAKVFPDAAAYLEAQELWVMFVGTGIVFTRTPEDPESYGYLDTTTLMGVITMSGYLEYDSERDRLYLLGQDTSYQVHFTALEIPTLYNYANDGAWLPNIASDGVPAWIKATGDGTGGEPEGPGGDTRTLSITVLSPRYYVDSTYYDKDTAEIEFNGIVLTPGTYERSFPVSTETVTITLRKKMTYSTTVVRTVRLFLNNNVLISIPLSVSGAAAERTVTQYLQDYIGTGMKLQWSID